MDYLEEALQKREKELKTIAAQTDRMKESNQISGSLRIVTSRSVPQYYLECKNDEGKTIRKYIKKSEEKLISKLVIKEYAQKVDKIANKQLTAIEKLLKVYDSNAIKKIYDGYPDARKNFVEPVELPDEEYALRWQEEEYQGKRMAEDAAVMITEKGEEVRSKSEKIIADYLYHRGIPYKYEKPLYLNSIGTIYPDFTILNVSTRQEFYLEHFGMMDNPEYALNAVARLEKYALNGYFPGAGLLCTFETSRNPLNFKSLERLVDQFLI